MVSVSSVCCRCTAEYALKFRHQVNRRGSYGAVGGESTSAQLCPVWLCLCERNWVARGSRKLLQSRRDGGQVHSDCISSLARGPSVRMSFGFHRQLVAAVAMRDQGQRIDYVIVLDVDVTCSGLRIMTACDKQRPGARSRTGGRQPVQWPPVSCRGMLTG